VTESTKIDRTTIAGTGLLSRSVVLGVVRIAVILGLPLLVSCHKGVGLLGVAGADDSPVTVRGGSVTLRAPSGFNCPKNQPCSGTNNSVPISDKSVIFLGKGVLPNPNPSSPLSTNVNWQLTFNFQDDVRREDRVHYLRLCSDPNCDTSLPLTDSPLTLKTDIDDNTSHAWGKSFWHPWTRRTFHLTKCGGGPQTGESACNHISSILYQSGSTSTTYTCDGGKCVIGIGNPLP
jgi:hypothetical protein